MIVLRLGWRNLWRNPRRSLITIAGIAFAFASLIALMGLAQGLIEQLLKNGTELMVGHIQIHNREYLPDRNFHETIGGRPDAADAGDWRRLVARLKEQPHVRAVAPRVFGFGLLSTGDQSAGAQIIGIDPAAEPQVSRLIDPQTLRRLKPGSILVGRLLAMELKAREGDEIAIVTQAADGTLGNDLFRMSAAVSTGLPYLDRSLAVARMDDLQELLALGPDRIHEIAIKVDHPLEAPAITQQIARMKDLPAALQVESWRDLLRQLSDYLDLARGADVFIIGLVVLFSVFGVLNTMMMATFERIREIGMLNALGMRPRLILLTILVEAGFLAMLGLAGGFLLGVGAMQYLSTYGLDLTRWMGELSVVETRMDPIWKAVWNWRAVVVAAVSLCLATVLAAYLPARRAVRFDPVEALHAPVMQ